MLDTKTHLIILAGKKICLTSVFLSPGRLGWWVKMLISDPPWCFLQRAQPSSNKVCCKSESRNSNHLCRHLELTLPSVVVFSQQL